MFGHDLQDCPLAMVTIIMAPIEIMHANWMQKNPKRRLVTALLGAARYGSTTIILAGEGVKGP
jgi:hypothetical protein